MATYAGNLPALGVCTMKRIQQSPALFVLTGSTKPKLPHSKRVPSLNPGLGHSVGSLHVLTVHE